MGASPSLAATLDYVVLAGLGIFFVVVFAVAVALVRREAGSAQARSEGADDDARAL
jgi:hypothetical protein